MTWLDNAFTWAVAHPEALYAAGSWLLVSLLNFATRDPEHHPRSVRWLTWAVDVLAWLPSLGSKGWAKLPGTRSKPKVHPKNGGWQ